MRMKCSRIKTTIATTAATTRKRVLSREFLSGTESYEYLTGWRRFFHNHPHPLEPPGATLSDGNHFFSPLRRNEKNSPGIAVMAHQYDRVMEQTWPRPTLLGKSRWPISTPRACVSPETWARSP